MVPGYLRWACRRRLAGTCQSPCQPCSSGSEHSRARRSRRSSAPACSRQAAPKYAAARAFRSSPYLCGVGRMYPVKPNKEAPHDECWKICLYQFCRALQFVLVMLRFPFPVSAKRFQTAIGGAVGVAHEEQARRLMEPHGHPHLLQRMKSRSKSLRGEARVFAPPATTIMSGRKILCRRRNLFTARRMRSSKQHSTAASAT